MAGRSSLPRPPRFPLEAEYSTVLHARAHGVSKVKLVRTLLAHLRFQARILLHRLHVSPLVKDRLPLGGPV